MGHFAEYILKIARSTFDDIFRCISLTFGNSLLAKIATPVFFVFGCCGLPAQPSAPSPSFEVASVRLNTSGSPVSNTRIDPGRLNIINISLRACIEWAWEVRSYQIASAPNWLEDVRFDVTAEMGEHASEQQVHLMLRGLLAERFGLKVHSERRELPSYALTVAKTGPRYHDAGSGNGSKFIEAADDGPTEFNGGGRNIAVQRVPMSELAARFSRMMGRPVTDKTGLKARYDIVIDIAPYLSTPAGGTERTLDSDPASVLMTALQEQLGLKLETGKEMMEVVVIDSANKVPTEN